MTYPRESIPQFWTKCRHCEGSGKEYFGCPDAIGTVETKCTSCKGKGGWFDEDSFAAWIDSQRQAYEFQRMADAELGRL